MDSYLIPKWPAPANVRAVITTRNGGYSEESFASFNLATHVGDEPGNVNLNRKKLLDDWQLPETPRWLRQVHSTRVLTLDEASPDEATADAVVTRTRGIVCAILTADCLPVLLCNMEGNTVAAAHAGWRGLSTGILRNTVRAMASGKEKLAAYLGPAISSRFFEVGEEVRDAFISGAMDADHARNMATYFYPQGTAGKLMADLYGLARLELNCLGIESVSGGDLCTFGDRKRFYSFRRDGRTGRMASLIWLC